MNLQDFRERFRHHQPVLQEAKGLYAVLVPLIEKEDGLYLLYEVRAAGLRHHTSEVCFPGGRMEKGETPVECALRETYEELGIAAQDIDILGELDFLYIRGDRLLYPILARINSDALAQMAPVPNEVSETFLVPLSWLRDNPPTFYRHRQEADMPEFPYEAVGISSDYPWSRHFAEIPIYHGLPHHLWGMTARITYYLLQDLFKENGSN